MFIYHNKHQMTSETEKILRSILLSVKTAESLKEVELIIENMCDKDWRATANEIAEKIKSERI